jgi:transcriptional regulator with XRE-family HTH domain
MVDISQIQYNPARFKSARENKNLTQAEVAELLGVEKAAVSKYEIGVGLPSAEALAKLCLIYEVPLDYFLAQKA